MSYTTIAPGYTIVPATRALALAAIVRNTNPDDVHLQDIPIVAWRIDSEGVPAPVTPWIRYANTFVAIYLPEKPDLLYDGMIFDDPGDFVDHVVRIVKRRKAAA